METFSTLLAFVWGIHRSPVNSPHNGQWCGAFLFSLICTLNKRLNKQSWGWWFKTPSRSLWRHCNDYATPWMLLRLNILFKYCTEHVTFGLLYVMFRVSTRIFYSGIPGLATDCLCDAWCRGLTTFLLYVGPLFGNLVWNNSGFVRMT